MPSRRPAEFCRQLLAALDASEGRRQRRTRDTTPDAGLAIKCDLLKRAVQDNPAPESEEDWSRDMRPQSHGDVCLHQGAVGIRLDRQELKQIVEGAVWDRIRQYPKVYVPTEAHCWMLSTFPAIGIHP